ncbi:MAG: hypothetical protein ACJ72H_00500 [Candidatus Sulfotelmatobacter sp.]
MFEEFNHRQRTKIIRDAHLLPRELRHDEHVASNAASVQLAAQDYLRRVHKAIGATIKELANLSLPPETAPIDVGIEYRFVAEKPQFDSTTVSYSQTCFGLPVWEAGLAVHMNRYAPFRIFGTQLTRHSAFTPASKPSLKVLARLKKLDVKTLGRLLGVSKCRTVFDIKSLSLNCQRLMVYRYERARRGVPESGVLKTTTTGGSRPLILPLGPLPRTIDEGRDYVVAAVDFRLDARQFGILHWVALVEAETLSVLYVRPLIDDACGLVFQADPMTVAGGPSAKASNRALNPLRSSVTLRGLNEPDAAGMYSLSGEIIEMQDFKPPTASPPRQPMGTDFDYQARTDGFAAVNAYYHCDRFFRLVEDLGFPRSRYFKATRFPLPVDHRAQVVTPDGIEINAHCQGNSATIGGLLNVRFALADDRANVDPIGIACDWRVVLHELGGHGTLWNHINKGRFKFAHSAGDSFAAILSDPGTLAKGKDRFITFPWIPTLDRRHDRKVSEGWGWGGSKDLGVNLQRHEDPRGYQSEQILSTSHFRLYRSIGGDSRHRALQDFAARFVAYLILRAIGSLTPAHSPDHVAGFAAALMWADAGDWTSEGHQGGAYAKVIRWAFEKQGLYQPYGAPLPVRAEGAPPPVDVYIEDSRKGEYQYQAHYWTSEAIWNRLAPDAGTTHQQAVAGTTNFAYVNINNRGTSAATTVTVRGFHCRPSAGLIYPDDWQPMSTAELVAPNVPPNSAAEITVGPFEWTPSEGAHDCMMMIASAPGDLSNIEHFTEAQSIPEWRLVPSDNNIGVRNIYSIHAADSHALITAFQTRRIHVKNPHARSARIIVRPILPPLLARRDWQVDFVSAGGHSFLLEPLGTREVVMSLKRGRTFTAKDLKTIPDAILHIEVYADDIPVGGLSFRLEASPSRTERR